MSLVNSILSRVIVVRRRRERKRTELTSHLSGDIFCRSNEGDGVRRTIKKRKRKEGIWERRR